MANPTSLLDQIDIAEPCSASWSSMRGDDRSRFCGDCKLNVYNLSDMTRTQAERFLQRAEGRVCTRFFRRADGTVITQDCGRIRRALRRRVRALRAIAAAVLAFLAPLAGCGGGSDPAPAKPTDVAPAKPEAVPQPPEIEELMGDVCCPEIPDQRMGRMVLPIEPKETEK